jgi:hypothetical protein
MHEQGQQLLAIIEPVPTHRAVVIGRHRQPPVAARVHPPDDTWNLAFP